MKIDEDLWSQQQYAILVSFVHNLAYHKVLFDSYKESNKKSEFWTRTINVYRERAVLDWCIVFGADSNETHWKKVVLDEQYQDDFRQYLRSATGITKKQIDKYWSEMTTFRNCYVAHRKDLLTYTCIPYMDQALAHVIAYDKWLRQKITASFQEPFLKKRYNRLIRTTEKFCGLLIENGPNVDQEYEGKPP